MKTTWTLFFLLLTFNLLDVVISGLAIHFGAVEYGLIFRLLDNWQLGVFVKAIGIFCLGMILTSYRQNGLLLISCLIYFGLCFYNALVLWQQVIG